MSHAQLLVDTVRELAAARRESLAYREAYHASVQLLAERHREIVRLERTNQRLREAARSDRALAA